MFRDLKSVEKIYLSLFASNGYLPQLTPEKIYIALFASNGYLPQFTPTLAIKGDKIAERNTIETKEKTRATLANQEENYRRV